MTNALPSSYIHKRSLVLQYIVQGMSYMEIENITSINHKAVKNIGFYMKMENYFLRTKLDRRQRKNPYNRIAELVPKTKKDIISCISYF